MSKNKVIITDFVHHLVISPWVSTDVRILGVASGTCNDKLFEAIFHNDPGLGSDAVLYHEKGVHFTTAEYQSIRRKLKSLEPREVHDHRNKPAPEGFESFNHYLYESMTEKHHGKKILLDVPFAEKEHAKSLGAQWDSRHKKWFIIDKQVDPHDFSRWMTEPVVECDPLSNASKNKTVGLQC